MMLGDLGARVVKVEHPEDGDVTRGWGPPYDAALRAVGLLPLGQPQQGVDRPRPRDARGRGVGAPARRGARTSSSRTFRRAASRSSGSPLAELRAREPAARHGLDHRLRAAAARTRRRPGFDLLAQAGAGLMAITGTPESAADEGRRRRLGPARRLLRGDRDPGGARRRASAPDAGAHVETDLFSATLGSLINVAQSALVTGEEAARHGNAHPQIVPYRTFDASDGDFVLGVGHGPAVRAARRRSSAGRSGPPTSATAPTPAACAIARSSSGSFPAIFRRETRAAWVARCREAGIPAGPVRGPLEALRSETARALGAVVEAGGVAFVASPIRVEGASRRLEAPARARCRRRTAAPRVRPSGLGLRLPPLPSGERVPFVSPEAAPRARACRPSACATRSPRARSRPPRATAPSGARRRRGTPRSDWRSARASP